MTNEEAVSEAHRILGEEQAARSAGACEEARRQERERVCKHISDYLEDSPYFTESGRMYLRKELVRLLESHEPNVRDFITGVPWDQMRK